MDNNSMASDFLNKVFAGVVEHFAVYVTIAILVLLIAFFRKKLLNLSSWFAQVKVHGEWSTTLTEPPLSSPPVAVTAQEDRNHRKSHEYVTLHQFVNKVWGDTIVQNETRDIYQVRGHLVGEKLSLTFRDKNGFDSGAILLKVKNKNLMDGFEVGVDPQGEMYSQRYVWRRRLD